jgi:hypothetical protein
VVVVDWYEKRNDNCFHKKTPHMSSASSIAEDLIKRIPGKPEYLVIFSNWNGVVEEGIASKCRPHKTINIGKDKVLVLQALQGYGLEIQHRSYEILLIVNTFLKKNIFSQIRVVQVNHF